MPLAAIWILFFLPPIVVFIALWTFRKANFTLIPQDLTPKEPKVVDHWYEWRIPNVERNLDGEWVIAPDDEVADALDFSDDVVDA